MANNVDEMLMKEKDMLMEHLDN